MLVFRVGTVKVRLGFGFFAVLMLYLYIGQQTGGLVVTALICCLLHEAGHLSTMLLYGCTPRAVTFYAGGIRISTRCTNRLTKPARVVILSAGCAVNLLLAGVSFLTGREDLAAVNLSLALFNLLPLPALDGGRLLLLLKK